MVDPPYTIPTPPLTLPNQTAHFHLRDSRPIRPIQLNKDNKLRLLKGHENIVPLKKLSMSLSEDEKTSSPVLFITAEPNHLLRHLLRWAAEIA
jgi:hypothetical protein